MRRRQIELSEKQRQELVHCRDHDPSPHMRMKAAAILKVAAGQTMKAVALSGLNKPVDPESVSRWIRRYEHDGLDGLRVQPGRGRKPAFFPCARQRSAQRGRSGASGVLSQPAAL
ncbi:MAG: helix-turn-helix domain-containing protein [Ktedonobacteraceae bacterium]